MRRRFTGRRGVFIFIYPVLHSFILSTNEQFCRILICFFRTLLGCAGNCRTLKVLLLIFTLPSRRRELCACALNMADAVERFSYLTDSFKKHMLINLMQNNWFLKN